jgi:hypothetical protein
MMTMAALWERAKSAGGYLKLQEGSLPVNAPDDHASPNTRSQTLTPGEPSCEIFSGFCGCENILCLPSAEAE